MDGGSITIPVLVLGFVCCLSTVCATVLATANPTAAIAVSNIGAAAVGAIAGLIRDTPASNSRQD